eukprot:6492984-Prymnesium_polylepis.1
MKPPRILHRIAPKHTSTDTVGLATHQRNTKTPSAASTACSTTRKAPHLACQIGQISVHGTPVKAHTQRRPVQSCISDGSGRASKGALV